MHRRLFLARFSALFAVGPVTALAKSARPHMQVWKSPTCGCCIKWVAHMQEAGFDVDATNVADVKVYKEQNGVPAELTSCHTALVDGFVVEGHVPAEDVIRMLEARPAIKGIAVPGMPLGSPGMEAPNPQAFDVIAFDAAGNSEVFASHSP